MHIINAIFGANRLRGKSGLECASLSCNVLCVLWAISEYLVAWIHFRQLAYFFGPSNLFIIMRNNMSASLVPKRVHSLFFNIGLCSFKIGLYCVVLFIIFIKTLRLIMHFFSYCFLLSQLLRRSTSFVI